MEQAASLTKNKLGLFNDLQQPLTFDKRRELRKYKAQTLVLNVFYENTSNSGSIRTCVTSLIYSCLSHALHFRLFTGILLLVMFWLEKEKPVK